MRENDKPLVGFNAGTLRLLPARTPPTPPSQRTRERPVSGSSVEEFVAHLGTPEGERELYDAIVREAVLLSDKPSPAYRRDQRRLEQARREERARIAERSKAVPDVPELDLSFLDAEDEADARRQLEAWMNDQGDEWA